MWIALLLFAPLLVVVAAAFSSEGKALRQKHPNTFGVLILAVGLMVGAFGFYIFYQANAAIGEFQARDLGWSSIRGFDPYEPDDPVIALFYNPPPTPSTGLLSFFLDELKADFADLREARLRELRGIRSGGLLMWLAGVAVSIVGIAIAATTKPSQVNR